MDVTKKTDKNLLTVQSSPFIRKIFVQEVLHNRNTNSTLIRSVSCEETLDNINEICACNFLFSKTGNIHTSTSRGSLNSWASPPINNKKTDCNDIPMEVDNTETSNKIYETNKKIAMLRNDENRTTKKLNLRRRRKKVNDSTKICSNGEINEPFTSIRNPSENPLITILTAALFGLCGVFLYGFIVNNPAMQVNTDVQLNIIKSQLQQKIVMQENAIRIVVNNFERMSTWTNKKKVLPFVGSTGIGKSFAANIIKSTFHPKLAHEINSLHLLDSNRQKNIISNLYSCCCNLLIIEDLKISAVDDVIQFINLLPKDHSLVIIPIFNIQDTEDSFVHVIRYEQFNLIKDQFETSGLYFEMVEFKGFDNSVIKSYLENELKKQHIDSARHEFIINAVIKNVDAKHNGLKGLSNKLSLAINDLW